MPSHNLGMSTPLFQRYGMEAWACLFFIFIFSCFKVKFSQIPENTGPFLNWYPLNRETLDRAKHKAFL